MHHNSYWNLFLIIIGLIVMAYTGFTLMKVYQHSRLSRHTDPLSIKWSIHKLSDDNYLLQVDYAFDWKGKIYSDIIPSVDQYLNLFAAREALERANHRSFPIWFDPANPQNSTLFKNFPVKYSIYTGILWLLFFYFIWLRHSMNRYKIQDR